MLRSHLWALHRVQRNCGGNQSVSIRSGGKKKNQTSDLDDKPKDSLVLPLVLGMNPRFAGVLGGFARPHGISSARTGVIVQSSTYCTLLQIYDTCATKYNVFSRLRHLMLHMTLKIVGSTP